MKSCWHLDPEQRPGFHELLRRWEKLLEDKTVYVNLSNNGIHNRDNSVEEDMGINSLNYLSRSESYEKCGEVGKSLDDQSQEAQTTICTVQGYETPVKVPKKTTSQDETPEEYTDMNGK
nr:unnamed protein product [Callosobruchus analis]